MGIYTGKRCVLIGPAPHITELNQRSDIRMADVVVRINEALPIPERIKNHTGNRCDVLYIWRKVIPHKSSWRKLKEIRLKPDAVWQPDWKREAHEEFKEKLVFVHPKHFYDLAIHTHTRPNTGLMAICDILDDNPSELYITGISFYQEGAYYKGYVSSIRNEKITKVHGNFAQHNQNYQLQWFKKNIYPLKNVKCDPILQKICEQLP